MDDKNKRNIHERDGVIYEPSSRQKRESPSERTAPAPSRSTTSARPRSTQGSRSYQKKKKKSNFALFYVITIVAGVIVCIVIFLTVFNSVMNSGSTPKAVSKAKATAAPNNIDSELAGDLVSGLGVITEVSLGSNRITISDLVDAGESYTVYVDSSSKFTNKHNEALVFQEVKAGDIVDFSFDSVTKMLKSIRGSNEAWEYRKITNTSINPEESTIKIGNETFKFDRDLVINTEKHEYTLQSLNTDDTVTVRGYGNKLCYLELVTGHGVLNIINKPDIFDGTIEIDTDIYRKLDDTEELDVPEGKRRVVIKGKNIDPYIKEITLAHGERLNLDLSSIDIIITEGTLQLYVDQENFTLTIDGVERNPSEPLLLKFGDHTIKVEKENFEPFEQEITMSEPIFTLNVALKSVAPTVEYITMIVDTIPAGAEAYVDNVYIGNTPVNHMATKGRHSVMVRKDGYVSVTDNTVDTSTVTTPEFRLLVELRRVENTVAPEITEQPVSTPTPGGDVDTQQ